MLKVAESRESDRLELLLSGAIDEDASLPSVDFAGAKSVILDFSGVDHINSCGIRDWVVWIKKIPSEVSVEFVKCKSMAVDQINMIEGFINKDGVVSSFFIPYFCEECDEITNKLVSRGTDYNGTEITVEEELKCEHCGEDAEIDVIEAKYFKFLANFS
ncbi:MAG: hypothetical protein HN353_05020 [Bdellovibrionales bacterium]|jgi:hypothetical protein|nr:hypothetical protein [Bdellovibrionales bacterium]MBT3526118.1 hypothetical protein [Bdellovibrionales bacterium]MBT7669590.1 hypothetical protein [Bdellovibrionales bacterium]MBT7768016.1 hypothetical protein [Bdellovibrionales bacterium]